MIANYQELTEALKQADIPFEEDRESDVLQVPVRLSDFEGVVLMRWESSHSMFQLVLPLPMKVPAEREAAAAAAIARINHVLVISGFGLDHDHGLLYFRLTVPRSDDGTLSINLLKMLIRTCVSITYDFLPALEAVIDKGTDPSEVLSLARKEDKEEQGAEG